jgi:hypothetical protein
MKPPKISQRLNCVLNEIQRIITATLTDLDLIQRATSSQLLAVFDFHCRIFQRSSDDAYMRVYMRACAGSVLSPVSHLYDHTVNYEESKANNKVLPALNSFIVIYIYNDKGDS